MDFLLSSGTEIWVNTLSIADKYRVAKRTSIINPTTKYPGGYVKTVDNFSFYWILDAGHMVLEAFSPLFEE